MTTKKTGREEINTGTDKRYVRRDNGGEFKESDDVGRSLALRPRAVARRDRRYDVVENANGLHPQRGPQILQGIGRRSSLLQIL